MTWYVYLLECSNGSLYTGVARNVEQRFRAHCAGRGARYTRAFPPQRIVHVLQCTDRSSALRQEYAIKQMSSSEKWRLCAPGARPDLNAAAQSPDDRSAACTAAASTSPPAAASDVSACN